MTAKPPPPPRFGQPEKRSRLKITLLWVFILIAVAGIAWMIKSSPPQGKLVCNKSAGEASFNAFGTCVEE